MTEIERSQYAPTTLQIKDLQLAHTFRALAGGSEELRQRYIALEMAEQGQIQDAKSLAALLLGRSHLEKYLV